jgi:glycosyltransferase involved in cell wall biosynthesis
VKEGKSLRRVTWGIFMLFSIIIPVYNVEAYLARAVDSVILQEYREPFEIILIDDGSSDASVRICDEYAQSDSRVKVIHKVNGGQSSARNVGLDVCAGEYIVFLDSDDWLDPDFLSRISEVVLDSRVDLVGFFFRRVLDDGSVIEKRMEYLFGRVLRFGEVLNFEWISPCVCAYAWKREIIEKNGIRFEEGIFCEDVLFSNYAMFFVETCLFLDYFGYNYFQRADSTMNNKSSRHLQKRLGDYCFVVDKLRDLTVLFKKDVFRVKWLENEIIIHNYQIFLHLVSTALSYPEAKRIFDKQRSKKFIPLPFYASGTRGYCFFRFLTQIYCPLWIQRFIQRAIIASSAFRKVFF